MPGLLDFSPAGKRRAEEIQRAEDALAAKRAAIDDTLQRIFPQAVEAEFEADHSFTPAGFKRHFAELEQYRAFCRREGLPDGFPCHPHDAVAYLFACAETSLASAKRAYRALEHEHRRCGDPSMSDIRIRVFMRGIRDLSVKKKSTIH
jgi:hypothetical protein